MAEERVQAPWSAAHAVETLRKPFDEGDLVTYAVGVAVKGQPMFVVEVPTTQGPEAAARRARIMGALQVDVSMDEVTTCDPGGAL